MSGSSTLSKGSPDTLVNLSVDEIYAMVDGKGKHPPPVPFKTLAASICLGVPSLFIVLPFSLVYQTVTSLWVQSNRLLRQWIPMPAMTPSYLAPIDSGYVVLDKEIIPWKDRKYDLVVLGATGFTGSLCVRHLVKTYGIRNSTVHWAIAGRSQNKLDQVKQRWAKELGNNDVLLVDTILVDTFDPSTLIGLVKNTRAISSTAGPFEQYGSPVVEYCAKFGTHYTDITGEVNWSKHMILAWENTAKQRGAKIVSFCGSDSIPWDLSTMVMEDALPQGETLHKVTFVDELVGQASGGTIATVMLNVLGRSRGEPRKEVDPFLQLADGSQSPLNFTISMPLLPKKLAEPPVVSGLYGGFFVMAAINAEVVKRGVAQRQRTKDLTYTEYARFPDWKSAMVSSLALPLAVVLLMNPLTKYFVDKLLPKPGEGPNMEDMEKNYFGCTIGYGEGSLGTKVETVMYFPQDQGYLHTARMLVESGLCLATTEREQSSMGGFFAPSTGMGHALLHRLRETGTYFAIKVTKSTCS